ncbi:nitrate reductase gamma subunit [Streptomyces sp. BK340]|nr:nitrate reductase gamma subunit [Streptomyces sp. BK340]
MALTMGGTAGVAAVTGLGVLLDRRLRVPAVRRATSRSDGLTHPLLALVLLAGLTATVSSATNPYDYRLGVAVWFRSLFTLDPDSPQWRTHRSSTRCTRCSPWPSSRCGRSVASSTPSRCPSAKRPGPTSSTAPAAVPLPAADRGSWQLRPVSRPIGTTNFPNGQLVL